MENKSKASVKILRHANINNTNKEHVVALLQEIISGIDNDLIKVDKAFIILARNCEDISRFYPPKFRNCGMGTLEIIGNCNYIAGSLIEPYEGS